MEISICSVNRIVSIAILIAAVGAVSVSAIPFAMANPGNPAHGGSISIVKDSSAILTITESDGSSSTIGLEIRAYNELSADPVSESSTGAGPTCDLADPGDGGVVDTPVWGLRDLTDDTKLIGYKFPGNSAGGNDQESILLEFGTIPGNPVSVTASADAVIVVGGVDMAAGVDIINDAQWVSLDGTGAVEGVQTLPSTGTGAGLPRFMSFVSCGQDTVELYVAGHSWEITEPVGGTVLPISMTSLLIAGMSNSVLWLVPLAAVAGGTFALLKFQLSRKE